MTHHQPDYPEHVHCQGCPTPLPCPLAGGRLPWCPWWYRRPVKS